MPRKVRDFKSVASLPLAARSLVAEADRENSRKRKSVDAMGEIPPASLFGPLAVALMNARAHGEDDKVSEYNDKAAELRGKTVQKLARRLAPKAKPAAEEAFDLSQFDVDEPTPAQLDAFEAYLEGHAAKGKAGKAEPAAEYMHRAEAIVGEFMAALSEVPLKDRGR